MVMIKATGQTVRGPDGWCAAASIDVGDRTEYIESDFYPTDENAKARISQIVGKLYGAVVDWGE